MTTLQYFIAGFVTTGLLIITILAAYAAFASNRRMEDLDRSMAARLRKKYDADNADWWN